MPRRSGSRGYAPSLDRLLHRRRRRLRHVESANSTPVDTVAGSRRTQLSDQTHRWPWLFRNGWRWLRLSVRRQWAAGFVVGASATTTSPASRAPSAIRFYRQPTGQEKLRLGLWRPASAGLARRSGPADLFLRRLLPRRHSTGHQPHALVPGGRRGHHHPTIRPKGWFIGAGDENTGYLRLRPACSGRPNIAFGVLRSHDPPMTFTPAVGGGATGTAVRHFKPWVQTIRTRWSTASTGVARSSRSTDLSRTDQLESPGICRGFFVPWRRMIWRKVVVLPLPSPRKHRTLAVARYPRLPASKTDAQMASRSSASSLSRSGCCGSVRAPA